MVERLAGSRVPVGDSGWAVTSLSPADPGFQPTRYWRGPVWPILNWVLQRGLERYGYRERAEQVRQAVVDLGRSAGFWEHYDPLTGKGHGGEQFAWTAALVLDLLTGRRTRRETWGSGDIDFDRISCYTRMTNRVERGIRRTDRRNVARVHPRSAGSKVTSSACGCPSGSARCISAQEGPL